jgi:hypothetical protein
MIDNNGMKITMTKSKFKAVIIEFKPKMTCPFVERNIGSLQYSILQLFCFRLNSLESNVRNALQELQHAENTLTWTSEDFNCKKIPIPRAQRPPII